MKKTLLLALCLWGSLAAVGEGRDPRFYSFGRVHYDQFGNATQMIHEQYRDSRGTVWNGPTVGRDTAYWTHDSQGRSEQRIMRVDPNGRPYSEPVRR